MGNLRKFLTSLSNDSKRINLFWKDFTRINFLKNVLFFKWLDNINLLRLGFEQPKVAIWKSYHLIL